MRRAALLALLFVLSCGSAGARPVVDPPVPAPHPAPAPAPEVPGPSLWSGRGTLVANPGNADPVALGQRGLVWVAVAVHDGQAPLPVTADWIEVLRRAGVRVCGWGVERTDPEADAALADRRLRELGLDCYIANAEFTYFLGYSFDFSARFVAAFRRLDPELPAMLITLGAAYPPYTVPINFDAWRAAGFEFAPEAYWNDYELYDPLRCVEQALSRGWPLAAIHPTLGTYASDRPVTIPEYLARVRASGVTGFSTYTAEQTTAEQWAALAVP